MKSKPTIVLHRANIETANRALVGGIFSGLPGRAEAATPLARMVRVIPQRPFLAFEAR